MLIFNDFNHLMVREDLAKKRKKTLDQVKDLVSSSSTAAFYSQSKGFNGRGRGKIRGRGRSSSSRSGGFNSSNWNDDKSNSSQLVSYNILPSIVAKMPCQICKNTCHSTWACNEQSNFAFVADKISEIQRQEEMNDPNWCLDSGASHHMTPISNNFYDACQYSRSLLSLGMERLFPSPTLALSFYKHLMDR